MKEKKVSKSLVNEHYKRIKYMLKENEEYIKKDIKNILQYSELDSYGAYVVAKLAIIILGDNVRPLTDELRKEFERLRKVL